MEELKPREISFKKALLITVVYFIVVLFCASFHEVWGDEAQVWMLAKNLSIPELLHHLVNEGHPSLFYLIVMPFAKLTNNFIFQKLICLISSAGAIFLLWKYSKFNTLTKTIITISAPFIYYFPVIARSYSLVPFLVFSIAILYSKSKDHPYIYSILIVLLANTHAIMFAFSALLGLDFLYKNIFLPKKQGVFDKKHILPSLIILIGLLLLPLQIAGTVNNNSFIQYVPEMNKINSFIRVLMLFAYNSFDDYFLRTHTKYFDFYSLTMFLLTVGTAVWAYIKLFLADKKIFWLIFLSVWFQIAIYAFVYPEYIFPTRIYCAYMILLFGFWILVEEKPKKIINILVSILFALTFVNSFKSYYGDIVFDYAGSKRAAQFIEKNFNPENSIIYTTNLSIGIVAALQLEDKFPIYSPEGKPIKYVVWKGENFQDTANEIMPKFYALLRKKNPNKDLYIISAFNPYKTEDEHAMDEDYFELLYISPNSLTNLEATKIWKYRY